MSTEYVLPSANSSENFLLAKLFILKLPRWFKNYIYYFYLFLNFVYVHVCTMGEVGEHLLELVFSFQHMRLSAQTLMVSEIHKASPTPYNKEKWMHKEVLRAWLRPLQADVCWIWSPVP